jgi:hypothetical protein
MFKAKFKSGVSESVLYFYDWMVEIEIYDTKIIDNSTFFLVKPLYVIKNKKWIWLNSNLFI